MPKTGPTAVSPAELAPWMGAGVLWAGLMLVPLARAWALAPDLGHGWAAPLLAAYLWWERWAERPDARNARGPGTVWWWMLTAALVCAVPLRLLLTPFPLWPVPLMLYVLLLAGLGLTAAWLLAGKAGVRWLGGPLLLLPGVLPWPGGIDRTVILPLREGIAALVAEISNLCGQPALAAGTSVRLTGGWVGIDEACGGIRSLQAGVMTALFFGEWLRLAWPRRAGLLLAAVVAAVAGNFGRVLFLSWCATHGTMERWHDAAGWAALGFSLLVTGMLGWWWRTKPSAGAGAGRPASVARSKSGVPAGLTGWVAVMVLMLGGIELGTRLWYAQGEAKRAEVPQWTVRFPQGLPSFQSLPMTASAREMLRPDRFVSAVWIGPDQTERGANYIGWKTGQVARSVPFLHNPAVCLPYAGCELVEELGVIRVRWRHGEIPFRAYFFRRMNEDLIVAYTLWDPTRGQPLAQSEAGWGGWWRARWRDVREARQHQPAQLLSFAMTGRGGRERLTEELAKLIQADPG